MSWWRVYIDVEHFPSGKPVTRVYWDRCGIRWTASKQAASLYLERELPTIRERVQWGVKIEEVPISERT